MIPGSPAHPHTVASVVSATGAIVGPRKKARSGEAAVDHTKAVTVIKGGREAETLEEEVDDAGVDDDEVASGGRRRPTMTVADAANDDNEAHDSHRRGRR